MRNHGRVDDHRCERPSTHADSKVAGNDRTAQHYEPVYNDTDSAAGIIDACVCDHGPQTAVDAWACDGNADRAHVADRRIDNRQRTPEALVQDAHSAATQIAINDA